MKRCTINVRDKAQYFEVEAFCVGGKEGVRAYFFHEGSFCVANGDDGSWWLMSRMHPNWVPECLAAMQALHEDYLQRSKRKTKRKFD